MKIDREPLCNDLIIYDVGGQIFEGIKPFHRKTSACVIDGELSEFFYRICNDKDV